MRQLKKSLITLWVTLSVSMGSYGYTGNEMLSKCSEENATYDSGVCIGFLLGFVEMDVINRHTNGRNMLCLPDESTYGQIKSIIVKHMKDNPEKLHLPFYAVSLKALTEAFPCEE